MIKKRKKLESIKRNGAAPVSKQSSAPANLIKDSNTLKPPTHMVSSTNDQQFTTLENNGPISIDAQINSDAPDNQLSGTHDGQVNILQYSS